MKYFVNKKRVDKDGSALVAVISCWAFIIIPILGFSRENNFFHDFFLKIFLVVSAYIYIGVYMKRKEIDLYYKGVDEDTAKICKRRSVIFSILVIVYFLLFIYIDEGGRR